ncbi:hypothetical protein [Halorubrum kocurii]|uniref:Uncharacterized protein n=1 Tax=Halorubrum kocurii JCM 14978 TaxID=1230456 RepID=M0NRS6_9EURY|nr:hypothetical protein [Halorubrum kocurii]EMA59924.1 hypothetical protein C468_14068 [Halorubrum kocurii JCM 14978]
MRRGRWVLALVAVVLLVGAAGVAVTAQESGGSESELTLSELKQEGTSYSSSPDSVRIEEGRMFWVIHWPAGITGSPGDPEDNQWEYLSPNDVVNRNSVYLRTINVDDREEVTVNVATYNVEEREVHDRETNTTTTEQVARNVTTSDHNVTLNRGWVLEEIPLSESQEGQHVTMWVGDSEELRWNFEHRSTATTQDLPFGTWGGLLRWSMLIFVVPIGVGGVVSLYGAKRVIDRTGKGPGWSYGSWVALFALIGGLIVASFWGNITRLLVEYPWAMVLYVLLFLFALMLETFEQHTKLVRFERDEISKTTMPSDEVGVDQLASDEKVLTIIDRPEEPAKMASDGVMAFLARLATGGAATLRTVDPDHEDADEHGETDTWKDPLRCQATVREGQVDMRAYVHPMSPSVVDYKPEGWELSLPELEDRDDYVSLASKVGLVLAAAFVATQLFAGLGGILAVALGVGWIGLRPNEAYARVWAAPVHYRRARTTALHLAEETDDAETIEAEREKRVRSEISTEKEKMDAVDKRDGTLVDEMFSIGEEEDDLPGADNGGAPSGDD